MLHGSLITGLRLPLGTTCISHLLRRQKNSENLIEWNIIHNDNVQSSMPKLYQKYFAAKIFGSLAIGERYAAGFAKWNVFLHISKTLARILQAVTLRWVKVQRFWNQKIHSSWAVANMKQGNWTRRSIIHPLRFSILNSTWQYSWY